ncbi:unnamed protein product [Closterium sp. NIES-64]|nr:unnamed protein product [Closterium sp. NIES-64]
MPASHECPRATVGDAVVLLCPLCAKAVRLVGDEDPNVTWARHERSGCDPSNLQRVANKPVCRTGRQGEWPTSAGVLHRAARRVANKCRCAAQGCTEVLSPANTVSLLFSPLRASSPPLYRVTIKRRVANKRRCAAQGCKEVLSPANTVTCRDCSRQTCLRHRFGADHACSGSQKNLQPVSFWAAGGAYSEKLMAGVQGAMAGLMAPAGVMLGLVVQWQGGAEAVQVGRVVAKGLSNAQDAGNVFPTLWLWFGMLRKIMKTMLGNVRVRHVACALACLAVALLIAGCYLSHEYVGSLLPRVSVSIDFSVLAALLIGATGSLTINFLIQRNFALVPISAAPPAAAAAAGAAAGGVAGEAGAGGEAGAAGGEVGNPGPGLMAFDIPDNACYFCVRRPATSKCGSCRLVYYCCRLCQMQAWRKHRHVCGAAAAAAARIQRTRALLTPSQWRALGEFGDAVRALIPAHLLVPTQPDLVASALLKIAAYVRQRPHLVNQPMADAVWAAALSMRGEGASPRLYMAWAWGFLEAAVESGSVDAFLAALRIDPAVGGAADLPRVNRWMKRGLCQALLMLNKRQEVGAFFRHAPRQQLLYF